VFQPRLILCPTDFSDDAAYALRVALDLARQNGGAVLLLHVADTLGPDNATFGEVATRLEPEAHVRDLEAQLLRQVPPDPGVPVRPLLREGSPAAEIDRAAREEGCDLIVLGMHGHTGLAHRLLRSIAERALQVAPCPVLVLPHPRPDAAAGPATGPAAP
jgi:nucleotide-binding universal stress UspA family protein